MIRKRKGKDLRLIWAVTTGGAPVSLEGRDITVELSNFYSGTITLPISVEGNRIEIIFRGTEHKSIGRYTLTAWENKGRLNQNVVDRVDAFELVSTTNDEGGESTCHNFDIETVDLGTSDLNMVGVNGITPLMKTENDYWHVSYDNGHTWERLGKCVGEPGKDGTLLYPTFSVNRGMELVMSTEMSTNRIQYNQDNGELTLNI